MKLGEGNDFNMQVDFPLDEIEYKRTEIHISLASIDLIPESTEKLRKKTVSR